MTDLIGTVRDVEQPRSIHLSNIFFFLHYKLTVIFLLAFSILVASQQLLVEPIDCEFDEHATTSMLNGYCFNQPTFVREQITEHAGVGEEHKENTRVRYYGYYSWVFYALFLQAVFFYLPHYMWKASEGGRIQALTSIISCPFLNDDKVNKGAERLSKYFFDKLHTHNSYAYTYFICEFLNLINVVAQIFFMHNFIGNGYELYGIHVMTMNREDMKKRSDQLFPITTICSFEKHALNIRKDKLEGTCLLTHNVLNEKIYGFLWFWMHFVAIMSAIVVLNRVATLFITSYRLYVFRAFSQIKNSDAIGAVYKKIQIGDWFLLLLLQKNLNYQVYEELIKRLAQPPKPDVSNF